MPPERTITSKMADALLLIDEVGPLAESNATDQESKTLYWSTARRLDEAGLVMPLGKDDLFRQLWHLSPAGEDFVAERRRHG